MPTHDNLHQIVDELSNSVGDVIRKRRCAQIIQQDNNLFLRRLKDIFGHMEDLENYEELFNLFYIHKYMLSLGDTRLIETLLSNDFYMETFGALEYDPELLNGSPTSQSTRKGAEFSMAEGRSPSSP